MVMLFVDSCEVVSCCCNTCCFWLVNLWHCNDDSVSLEFLVSLRVYMKPDGDV